MTEPVSLHDAEQTLEAAQPKRYAAYPAYRPSGIDWLGDIPEHWPLIPLKHRTKFINGMAFKPDEWSTDGVPIIRIVNLNGGDDFNCFEGNVNERYHVEEGDLLFGWSGNRGTSFGPFLWWRPGLHYLNQHIFKLTDYRDDKCWFYWALKAVTGYIEEEAHGIIGMVHVTKGRLGAVKMPVPPRDEQQAIARFLDEQTKKIDDLIEAKRDLVALLKEKRQAVITHAVTKGLNPDARLKPSGVDWLGDVPEHWDVKSLKWDSPVLRGASPRPIDDPIYFDDEGEYAWVRIADVTAAGMYLEQTTQRLSKLGSSLSVKLQPGELFLSIAGSVGKPCITKIKCCIHDGFVYFPRLSCNRKFLYYIFASGEPYKGLGKLGTQLNLNTDTVGSIHIAFPPDDEQEQIVEYLDAEMTKFDGLIEAVDGAIEKLATLRISLISAAVTGKIDVRGGAA
jgi:type I restriction enzyme S subunit